MTLKLEPVPFCVVLQLLFLRLLAIDTLLYSSPSTS